MPILQELPGGDSESGEAGGEEVAVRMQGRPTFRMYCDGSLRCSNKT